MSEKFVCPICGAPTSSYMGHYRKDRLCKKHASDLKNGLIEIASVGLDESDNTYRSTATKSKMPPIERQQQDDGKCVVCGANAPKGSLCKECYYEMLDYKDSFDKNSKIFELKDYYFNLRSNIYRMKNFNYIQSNCNKLMALAVLSKDLYDDESLTDRIINDIKDIIEKKKPQEKQENSEYSKTQDSRKEEVQRTADGHYVKSYPETVIDDILYESRITHCYEKKVSQISSDEQTVTADWFIPVTDNRHGIYIEYWGMNTKEYLQNKERKRNAYKAHDIPLIEIEKEDYKDKRGLEDRIISELNMLAKKYFNLDKFVQ